MHPWDEPLRCVELFDYRLKSCCLAGKCVDCLGNQSLSVIPAKCFNAFGLQLHLLFMQAHFSLLQVGVSLVLVHLDLLLLHLHLLMLKDNRRIWRWRRWRLFTAFLCFKRLDIRRQKCLQAF